MRLALIIVFCVLAVPLRADMRCAEPPYDALPELQKVIADLAPAFAEFSQLGETLTGQISKICVVEPLIGARGYFEPETGRLMLATGLPPGLAQAVLVHELRHVQQFDLGACPAPGLSMQDHAQAVFAMEADASVTSLVVADYLRTRNRPAMWQALADWPMQADIAAAYDAARGDGIDAAAAAAFAAWYDDEERRRSYYAAVCMEYLDRQERLHRLPAYGALSDTFFTRLCRLPDGRPYPCRAP